LRGRYKAILVEEETYLLQVSRYIHLNPVSANICQNPANYPWSSLRYYLDKNIKNEWLKTTTILKYFHSCLSYAEFINEGVDDELQDFYKNKFYKSILGSKEFLQNALSALTEKQKISCTPDIKRLNQLPSIDSIATIVANYFSVEVDILKTTKPGTRNIPRMFAIFLAKQCGQLSYQKISSYFTKISADSVGMVINRFEKNIQHDERMVIHCEKLVEILIKDMLYVST